MIPEKVLSIAIKCLEIWEKGKSLDDILDFSLKGCDKEYRSKVSSVLFIFFRKKACVDYVIDRLANKKMEPFIRRLISISLIQLFYQDGVPQEIVVDVAVEHVKKVRNKRASGFVNAVLRNALRGKFKSILENAPEYVKYNLSKLLMNRWQKNFSDKDFSSIINIIGKKADYTFRLLSEGNENALESLECEKIGLNYCKDIFSFYKTKRLDLIIETGLLQKGKIYIQDPATAMAVSLSKGLEANFILDVCSAPGGKTLMLSELFPNAEITAADRSANRLKRVDDNIKRANRNNITTIISDALDSKLKNDSYDLVFADVPCSNTGVIRRRPDVLWRFSERHLNEILKLQADILFSVSKLVKPGGALIYSTCSIEKDENRLQIEKFLSKNKNFEFVKDVLLLPSEDNDGAYGALIRRGE